MLTLLFWQCSILGVLTRHDSPIVIERPPNRVEFDDLLMEYNRDEGPTTNVSVNVFLTVNAAGLFGEVLRTSITMDQTWTDMRLSFQGVSEVPLPNNVMTWHPDTVVLNALRSEIKLTSSFLNFDGTVRRRQLLLVEVLCDEPLSNVTNPNVLECPLQLSSFSNRGCDEIGYTIEKINIDRVARISSATEIKETLDDHLNRTSLLAAAILYLEKPRRLIHNVIDKSA
ncbi:hypothetical protein KIN20_006410 [Parelaphostrongylus tenuis]|uniref:Neurotransmitter-gated ion-channel ligand-binding domain-containing protein n=1 Tax=Parelaphostrongylus tenuis TaxID=148309 RepID=A0AAD5MK47_PARTN|nr:hypothetical protein KIN20_006410 [Parelaphostrongylus tenuis]